ncbi:Hsp20 family protein [Clostridium sp. AL.422]|uniref:Hsp20 family protein n=1 Tax=Clostridium TaxID=1485 RepID=UPI00293DBA45|nr:MULTISPECIES: Hsp20 family protein [unclassified Clostridium]MDV4150783.1 Hsp20 family protein [Clostridium sp. AL.422]
MFEMFPFLFNNIMGTESNNNRANNNMTNKNNYNGNLYSGNTENSNYKYGSFTNGNDIINVFSGSFAGTFNNIFNDVFNTLINNEGLINSIVDSVINSDAISSFIEEEDKEEIKLDFRDYGDRYLIEGKLEDVSKKDIDIDYENDHISIRVKRHALKDNSHTIAMIQEKDYAERTFYVPRVDSSRIQAVFNADVLRIYLKKLPEVDEGTTVIDVDEYSS